MDKEKRMAKTKKIVDYQFRRVIDLTPEAYQDSLRMIAEQIEKLYTEE